jgi:hypothetical protein
MRLPKVYSDGKGSFTIDDAIAYHHYIRHEESKASMYHYEVQIKPMSDFFTDLQIIETHSIIKRRRITEIYNTISELHDELKRLEE